MPNTSTQYSVVVPFHNEERNVMELYQRIVSIMTGRYEPYEMVFVDDCSNDSTNMLLKQIASDDPRVTVISLARNFGQTPALAAGFDHAVGEIIIAMDGDLQHDPADIPTLVEKFKEGYDLVSGWRKDRVDNLLMRRIPSRVANWLMAKLSGVPLHDFGTTFKAYRGHVIKGVKLYGELHRFIPALASWNGARIVEVPITNIVRQEGESHYGISRTLRVMLDLLTVRFLLKYVTRPMHFFGPLGLVGLGSGGLLGIFLLGRKLAGVHIFSTHGPLLVLAAILILAGLQFLSIGLVAELVVRNYFETSSRRIYTIESIFRSNMLNTPSNSQPSVAA